MPFCSDAMISLDLMKSSEVRIAGDQPTVYRYSWSSGFLKLGSENKPVFDSKSIKSADIWLVNLSAQRKIFCND